MVTYRWNKVVFKIFISLLLSMSGAKGQALDSIKYTVPVNITTTIQSYIKSKNHVRKFYVIMSHEQDTTAILLSTYDNSTNKLYSLIKNTNRYLTYNGNRVLPILLQQDLLFFSDLHQVINKGKRNESLVNTEIHVSGYLIRYKGSCCTGKLIDANYFQY